MRGRRCAGRTLLQVHSWLVFVFLYAPIVILIAFSFNRGRQTAVWEGFTLDWYVRLAGNELILGAVQNSLIVAAAATLAATVVGTLTALALDRYLFRGRELTRGLLYLPIIIPEIVIGVALLTFFGAVQWRLSIWTVIVAHIAFSIPFVSIIVRARLAGIDRTQEEAAMDLGAGPLETFRRVTLPQIRPGILAGALLAFTLSIDDYVITSFVAGVGATTLPLQIYSMLKVGVTPEVNAVSALVLALTLVLIALAFWLMEETE